MDAQETIDTGYSPEALDGWARIARDWQSGKAPDGLPYLSDAKAERTPRQVFLFMINGAKVRAPAAAQALIERLGA
jgi:uncharacterized protein YecE (DUF72 family)